MLFRFLLQSVVRKGTLKLLTADGRIYVYGDGKPPQIAVKLHRKRLEWTLGVFPDLKIGEAYMDGTLTVEEGDLYGFISLLLTNYNETGDKSPFHWHEHFSRFFGWLARLNTVFRASRNAAFHYDVPDELYRLFLDPDRQYSCGYFTHSANSLEQAQLDKKRHIASKLLLNRSGLKVLDIGSGWGGLGLYLAREAECRVRGVTLSVNQYNISVERAAKEGLSKNCTFALRDYRQETETYDRIVSVGMFEHVGKKHYGAFFRQIRRLLAEDGVCLLHSIGRFDEPRPVSSFIKKHIFPGTYVPTLSEVTDAISRSGLFVTDVEILRLHYAETIKRWRDNLHTHRAEIIQRFGETFYRKWSFYFTGAEIGFRIGNLMVFQIQLSKKLETVPWTRDYMLYWEEAHQKDPNLVDRYVEDIVAASATLRKSGVER